jgi:tRNA(fMet)-specific endonuclease VapC
MRYLLDTCTVSDFVRGERAVMGRIKATSPALLCVSSVTRMEIDYGLALSGERARKLTPVLEAFFSVVVTLPFDQPEASATAAIRAALKSRGQPIGAYDALIAGTALARGLILVTSNVSEFSRIGGLKIENWRR